MAHLLIIYELFLLVVGVLTLTLLFTGRKKRLWLKPFIGFYSMFFIVFLFSLVRAYLLTNIDNTSAYFIYISHGITTLLNFLILIFGMKTMHSLLSLDRVLLERIFSIILILSALLMISPYSLVYYMQSRLVEHKLFFYVASLPYIAALAYLSWNFTIKFRIPTDRKDRVASLLLGVFSLFGFIETLKSFIGDLINPQFVLNASSGTIIFSSIPYAVLSFFIIAMVLSDLVSTNKTPDDNNLRTLGYSPREIDVIKLIIEGHPNGKIADELCISKATVKTHVNNIFRKAQVENRFELAKKLENGCFPPKG